MKVRLLFTFLAVFCLQISGCGSGIDLEGPPTPGEESQDLLRKEASEVCQFNRKTGNFEGRLRIVSGTRDGGFWSQGGGCIQQNLNSVWLASQSPDFMKWDRFAELKIVKEKHLSHPVQVQFDQSLIYRVSFITAYEWKMRWSHTIESMSGGRPAQIQIDYGVYQGQKYPGIQNWKGKIFLTQVSPQVTAFFMKDYLKATSTQERDSVNSILQKFRYLSRPR